MKVLSKLIIITILPVSLWSCKKGGLNSIKGSVVDRYTGEPIPNLYMNFDVASGSGFFGSSEKEKYSAITDQHGEFKIKKLGNDRKNRFYLNVPRNELLDTTQIQWKYITNGFSDDSLWISKKHKTILELKPSGMVCFHHPIANDPNSSVEKVVIEAYGQTDVLTLSKQVSEIFYFYPSRTHEIELTFVSGGNTEHKTITKYIPNAYYGSGTSGYGFKQLDVFITE